MDKKNPIFLWHGENMIFSFSNPQFNMDIKTNKLSLEFTWKMDTKNPLFCGMGSLSALSTTVTTASAYMSVTGLAIH